MSNADMFAPKLPGDRAQDSFADRKGEQVAFDEAYEAYLQDLRSLESRRWVAQDLERPRKNVLSFYGVGGIGKSALLDRIEDRMRTSQNQPAHWSDPPNSSSKPIVTRIDVASMSGVSVEAIVLSIRVALHRARIETTAFDLFLNVYWPSLHPNERLDEHPAVRGFARRFADHVGLADHVESVASEIVGRLVGVSTVGMTAVRVADYVVRLARERRLSHTALADCALLPELLESAMSAESVSLGAHLLAWDIERAQLINETPVVVLLDTLEALEQGQELDLERMVWLLPNVLFVIAGRNLIRWNGDYGGQPVLPGRTLRWECLDTVRTVEPRPHLVGQLSDTDSADFLVRRLGLKADGEVITQIVESTAGFPIHLDLSVQRYIQVASSRTPVASDFNLTFDVMAVRVLRDLSLLESRALLACCLFDSFDEDLIQQTAGLENVGPVRTLFARSLIQRSDSSMLGRELHSVLRATFLSAADLGQDQQSDSDWTRLAQRGFDELIKRSHGSTGSTLYLLSLAASRIALTFPINASSLPSILHRLVESTQWNVGWSPEALPGKDSLRPSGANWAPALVDGIRTVMQRQESPRGQVAEHLRRVLATAPRESGEFDILRYFHAEALRDLGQLSLSEAAVAELIGSSSPFASRALHNHIHLLRRKGMFTEVEELLLRHEAALEYANRLRGDLMWTQARFEEAANQYRLALNKAQEEDSPGETATCWASIAFAQSWRTDDNVLAFLENGRDALRGEFHSFSYLLGLIAKALIAGKCDEGLQSSLFARAEALRLQHSSLVAYAELVHGFWLAVGAKESELRIHATRLKRQAVDRDQFGYVATIVQVWAGMTYDKTSEHWLTGDTLDRWAELPERRRQLG